MAIKFYAVNTAQQTFQNVPAGTWNRAPYEVAVIDAATWPSTGNLSRSLLNISGDVDEWYPPIGGFWYKDGDLEGDAILVSSYGTGTVISDFGGLSGVKAPASADSFNESPITAGLYFIIGLEEEEVVTPVKFGYSFNPPTFKFDTGFPSGFGMTIDITPTVETVDKVSPTNGEQVKTGDTVLLEWTYDGTGCSKFLVEMDYIHPIDGAVHATAVVDQPTKELDVSALVVQLEIDEIEEFTWSVRGWNDEDEVYEADPDPNWVVDVYISRPTLVSPANGSEFHGYNTDLLKEMIWDDEQAEAYEAYTVYISKSIDTPLPQDDRSRYSILSYKMYLGLVLEPGTEYSWFVRRVLGASTKDSELWTFTTNLLAPPSPSRNSGNGKINGLNNMTTIRRLVAASQNMIWYET
jgi:hypothetical protein